MTRPEPSASSCRQLQSLRVLLVDDQPHALRLMREMLANMGLKAVTATSSGEDAVAIVQDRGSSFDAILCDWNMPRPGGLETLQRVRRVDPDIPFLMVTGNADPTAVLAAKDSGVSGYLKKPFSTEDLRRKLSAVAQVKAFRAQERRPPVR